MANQAESPPNVPDLKSGIYTSSYVPAERFAIKPLALSSTIPTVYPSTWFGAPENADRKPQIIMPNITPERTLLALRSSISHRISNTTLNLPEAMLYLELAISNQTGQITDDWRSFGRVIGLDGTQVPLTNLYRRVDIETEMNLQVGLNDNERDELWQLMYIASIYRVSKIEEDAYRQIVCNGINTLLRSRGAPLNVDITLAYENYKTWVSDRWFCAMIACIDMYMVKLPKHPLAEITIGTITSRFRDCSALMDMADLCKRIDADVYDISRWMWSKKLGGDFLRIFCANEEEVETVDSYTPYLTDLGLCSKSPYSATSNPNLHFWVHIIMVCLGSARSKNSRIVGNINMAGLAIIGMICAYAFLSRTEAKRQSFCTGEDPDVAAAAAIVGVAGEEEDLGIPVAPTSLEGDDWYKRYKDANFCLPDKANRVVSGIWGTLNKTRDGIIGPYAYDYQFRGKE